jgi:amidohydrolase
MKIDPEVQNIEDELIKIRRDIHKNPETGLNLPETFNYIKNYLIKLKLKPVTDYGISSIVVDITGNKKRKIIALRADMDALPITELSNLEFKSDNPGKCHACGHDGHISILLGVAKLLSKNPEKLDGTVRLIFQSGEEGHFGARYMVEDGVLNGVDEIFGLHLWNYKEFGWVGSNSGTISAITDEFSIKIVGKGGHGAIPQETKDSIIISSHLILQLQSIISRNMDPLQSAVLSVGTIKGGSNYNIISESVTISGTVRTFSKSSQELIIKRMEKIIDGISHSFECEITLDYKEGYPEIINNSESFLKLESLLKTRLNYEIEKITPLMIGEDFSYYTQKIPGCFFLVGSGAKDKIIPHHSPYFEINEKSLLVGTTIFYELIKELLMDR